MRRLLLLRHAKSDWSAEGQPDHERPLAPRGQADAPRMGAFMAEHSLLPDQALVSTALRTRQTWDLVARTWPRVPPVRFDRRLYEAGRGALTKAIAETSHAVNTLMLVGHNPGLHELSLWLTGRARDELREQLLDGFPTAALAVIEFDAGWSGLTQAAGALTTLVFPKQLRA